MTQKHEWEKEKQKKNNNHFENLFNLVLNLEIVFFFLKQGGEESGLSGS